MTLRSRTALLVSSLVIAPLVTTPPASAGPPPDSDAAAAVAVLWQRIAVRTIFLENAAAPPIGALYLAFASTAVDAAAAESLQRGGSARAAVATAAHDVLAEYYPTSTANLDADLATTLAAVPDGPGESKGVRIGARAADRLIASRVDDGRNDLSIVYSKPTTVGYWQPGPTSPPTGGGMAAAWVGFVDPLVDVPPVHLDGPDPLTSRAYAADYQEVLEVGSSTPTPELADEALTAQFFNYNAVAMYRVAVCDLLDSEPMGLRETTHLFATLDAATSTSIIRTWRLKYDVGFWRPVQAINDLRDDGNPATTPQPGWAPLVTNPSYSDYTSGHASATAPFAAVMRHHFGDDVTLTLTSPLLPDPATRVRVYHSLTDLEYDALNARIWGGLHFRDAMEDGYHLGHATAHHVMEAMD